MKLALQILAALMFAAAIVSIAAGVITGQLVLGIAAMISGLVFALILYAQSEIVESLDVLLENQKRLIRAFNEREQHTRQ